MTTLILMVITLLAAIGASISLWKEDVVQRHQPTAPEAEVKWGEWTEPKREFTARGGVYIQHRKNLITGESETRVTGGWKDY